MGFFDFVDSTESVGEAGQGSAEDLRSMAQLLVEQVEFADVVLLNKCDLVTEEQLSKVEHALRSLNGGAELHRTTHSNVPVDKVLGTGRFSFERAAEHPGWLRELRGTHIPETDEYGISSFIYTSDRPFHPLRLYQLTGQDRPHRLPA